jgi:hypothetical protein
MMLSARNQLPSHRGHSGRWNLAHVVVRVAATSRTVITRRSAVDLGLKRAWRERHCQATEVMIEALTLVRLYPARCANPARSQASGWRPLRRRWRNDGSLP